MNKNYFLYKLISIQNIQLCIYLKIQDIANIFLMLNIFYFRQLKNLDPS